MLNITTEILDGTTYYTTVSARGNETMVWTDSRGEIFVSINLNFKHISEIKKPSKELKALLEFMATDEAEKTEKAQPESNPRYTSFVKAFGNQPNWVYMDFINKVKIMFIGDLYGSIYNHDKFTDFIKNNAHKVQLEAI